MRCGKLDAESHAGRGGDSYAGVLAYVDGASGSRRRSTWLAAVTTVIGATSEPTTVPAPTTEPRPIVTPGAIVAAAPIHTSSSITIGECVM